MITALLLAGIVYQTYTIPVAQRPCPVATYATEHLSPDLEVLVQPFDPALGHLDEIAVVAHYTPHWLYRAENTSPLSATQDINWFRGFQMNVVHRPNFIGPVEFNDSNILGGLSQAQPSNNSQGMHPALTAFDGITDFTGSSGFDTSYGNGYTTTIDIHMTRQRELLYYSTPGIKKFYFSPRFLTDTTNGFPFHWASSDDISLNFNGSVTIMFLYH